MQGEKSTEEQAMLERKISELQSELQRKRDDHAMLTSQTRQIDEEKRRLQKNLNEIDKDKKSEQKKNKTYSNIKSKIKNRVDSDKKLFRQKQINDKINKNYFARANVAFYPNKSRVVGIDLKYLNFQQPSELIINDYPNLEGIYGHNIPNLTQLTITNCPQLEEIDINSLTNNQQLILNNLPNLRKLVCSNNKLTTLDLSAGANLAGINCYNNQLTQIKLPRGEKLRELNLDYNNLNQDLSFLSGLVNLK